MLRRICALAVVAVCGTVWAGEDPVVEISAGKHDRDRTPVWVEGRAVVVTMKAGEVRRGRVSELSGESGGDVQSAPTADGREQQVRVGGKPVLRYNIAVDESPDAAKPYYRRSGYIHPVYDPAGRVITDDFPADHMHQHAVMFAHTRTIFDGRPINFWDQHNGRGTVLDAGNGVRVSHWRGAAELAAGLVHLDLTSPQQPVTVLRETWKVRVYDAGGAFHLFDIESSQAAAADKPLEVQEYHYGGMAVRGAREWFGPGKCAFTTSEGKDRIAGNASRPRWVDMSGEIDGRWSGVTVLCHPENLRFPQPVRLHPSKPYFSYSPNVLGPFNITKEPYVSRYRYVVHMGKVDTQLIERLWNDFAEPPAVRVVGR